MSSTKAPYLVHLLTASGVIPAAFAVREMVQPECNVVVVFGLLLLTTLIDAVDGPLARRFDVKETAASVDGRVIDDLLDYLTFAFIPLMLIWRMQWMPSGLGWTVTLAMMASLLGFAHREAKDEARGVFRGFPSYWNLYAIYAGVFSTQISPWLTASMLWILTALTVMPVWVLYPNLAPRKWKRPIFLGGIVWVGCLAFILLSDYPSSPMSMVLLSLVYPAFYVVASVKHARLTR
ncbi:CDP-alcohol phosphatidyltransferase family protein [Stieleria varia]|uniref:Phosphatidylcholine synthase n=1 Tax=Stieleria varia TaxID=2528005 RepID=A0A5C6B805_9BACT|nr:CDP-alcohol phosphatidyltransferase family protein [Stieleria varia]TWU08088.1 Phosphatidylcholine synthase [Stieleria varia]